MSDTKGWKFAEKNRAQSGRQYFLTVGKWPTFFSKGCNVTDTVFYIYTLDSCRQLSIAELSHINLSHGLSLSKGLILNKGLILSKA